MCKIAHSVKNYTRSTFFHVHCGKFYTGLKTFTEPAVVMVVTNMRCDHHRYCYHCHHHCLHHHHNCSHLYIYMCPYCSSSWANSGASSAWVEGGKYLNAFLTWILMIMIIIMMIWVARHLICAIFYALFILAQCAQCCSMCSMLLNVAQCAQYCSMCSILLNVLNVAQCAQYCSMYSPQDAALQL